MSYRTINNLRYTFIQGIFSQSDTDISEHLEKTGKVYIWNVYKQFCTQFIEEIAEIRYSHVENEMLTILPEISNHLKKELTNPDEFKDNELE